MRLRLSPTERRLGSRTAVLRLALATCMLAIAPSTLLAQPVPLTVTVSADVTFPVVSGTPVTWTASASGGEAPYQFLYYLFDGSRWNLATSWSSSASWTWTPTHSGEYALQVWVRNATNTNAGSYDAIGSYGPVTVSAPARLTVQVSTFCPSVCPPAPGPIQVPLSYPYLAVIADGGAAPYSYKYFMDDGAGWTVLQDWGPWNQIQLPVRTTGRYQVQVWARNAFSEEPFDAWSGATIDVIPSSTFTDWLNVRPATPTSPGVPIAVTADSSDPDDSRSYRFLWRWKRGQDFSGWHVGREWGPSNTWTFTPSLPYYDPNLGNFYAFQVWIREYGSENLYDTRVIEYDHPVFPTTVPLQLTSLTPDHTFPVPAGTSVRWTAQAVGGTGPYLYRFFAFDGVAWQISDWSPDPAWTWTPGHAGVHLVQAWVKRAGSVALYDAWLPAEPVEVDGPAALTVDALTAAPMPPSYVGSDVTFTASASGGMGPYSYRFLIYNGSAWSVAQDWSADSHWTWQPERAGSYTVQVWVRNAGSLAAFDAWTSRSALEVREQALAVAAVKLEPTLSSSSLVVRAKAIGGTGPYTYRFVVRSGSTWSVGQEWSASNTWTFVPAGNLDAIQVLVRNVASSALYDAWAPVDFAVPLARLMVAPEPPKPADTPLLVTAIAELGTPPYAYRFRTLNLHSQDPGSTVIVQDWSPSNTIGIGEAWFAYGPGAEAVVHLDVRDANGVTHPDAASLIFPTERP